MSLLSIVAVFVVCLCMTMALIPVVSRLAIRKGWNDDPDRGRKIHSVPIPNVGGLAIAGGWLLGVCLFVLIQRLFPSLPTDIALLPSPLILVGAVAIAGVGFLDDLYDVHFLYKLLAQLVVTAFVIAGGVRIGLMDDVLGGGFLALAVSYGLTALWMVGTMNAVNFLDGMDGLAAGVVAIILVGLAAVYLIGGRVVDIVLSVALVGSLLGFLRHNFHPAKIFMGDSGSLFLGYLLAVYALHGKAHDLPVLALVIPAVAMGLPILDTGTSIARRFIVGKSLFSPDSDHIHHRLSKKLSHRNTVLALYGIAVYFSAGAMLMAAVRPRTAVTIFLLGTAIVAVFLFWLGFVAKSTQVQPFGPLSVSGDGAVGEPAMPATVGVEPGGARVSSRADSGRTLVREQSARERRRGAGSR